MSISAAVVKNSEKGALGQYNHVTIDN